MTPTETTAPPVTATYAPLTAHDACDQCGYVEADTVTLDRYVAVAVARVRWLMPSGLDLVLCGHHSHADELALIAQGAVIVTDQRGDLLVKRPDSGV